MLREWLSRSHSGAQEIGGLAVLYGIYELVRGAGGEDVNAAIRHAADIVDLERSLGIYGEPGVQHALEAIPYVPAVVGLLYVLLHFVGTAVVLVWIYRRHSRLYPVVRTTFVAATALALVGYVVYPAAPPRLAGLGFSDTVTSSTGLDLSSNVLGPLYNPVAAVPSLHFGYALIVGVVLATLARRRAFRVAGAIYPGAMLLIIVATGNHFLTDAALGGLVAAVGWLVARRLVDSPKTRSAMIGGRRAQQPERVRLAVRSSASGIRSRQTPRPCRTDAGGSFDRAHAPRSPPTGLPSSDRRRSSAGQSTRFPIDSAHVFASGVLAEARWVAHRMAVAVEPGKPKREEGHRGMR
jgi:hypothetical protein